MARSRILLWVGLVAVAMVMPSLVLVGATASPTVSHTTTGSWWGDNWTSTDYAVTFTETGLPAGTWWSVRACITPQCEWDFGAAFNASNGTTVVLSLPNGSYNFDVHARTNLVASPFQGSFNVSGASPPPIEVRFALPTLYTLTFRETGLPTGTTWSVFLHGNCAYWVGCGTWSGSGGGGWSGPSATASAAGSGERGHGWGDGEFNSTNGTQLTFQVPNGSYWYRVGNVWGYGLVGPESGLVNVSGTSPAPIGLQFTKLETYSVTFEESGLPNGTNWSVQVGQIHGWGGRGEVASHAGGARRVHCAATSNSTTLTISLVNGSYRYRVGFVPGYYTNESFGTFNVTGASPATIEIVFVPVPAFNVTFNETGLPAGTDWGLKVVGHSDAVGGTRGQRIETVHAAKGAVSFSLPSGRYRYSLVTLPGWHAKGGPTRGKFSVRAGGMSIEIVFTRAH